MLKKFWIGLAVAAISISTSFTALAGEWKLDEVGWWYDFGDATYAKDGWHWVERKCYYFTPDGYCLLNTTTPDGYTVDASGAWSVDGVVQMQESNVADQTVNDGSVYQIGNITFTMPADYRFESVVEDSWGFSSQDDSQLLVMASKETELSESILSEEQIYQKFDSIMLRRGGVWDSRETVELATGKWRTYVYSAETTRNGYSDKRYMRLKNNHFDMVILGSKDPNMDKDAFMNQYIH